jgi:hypothetical protein
MDDAAAVEILVAFVKRLRRVAEHPLALQDNSDFLHKLMTVETKAQVRSDGTVTMRSPLPDEVQFESLATRLRPFTLRSDPTYYVKALDALDHLTDLGDPKIQAVSQTLRTEWDKVTDRTTRTRAYQISTEAVAYTDIELAFAWLYQDAVKSDASTTGEIGIVHRYRAAVGVFSHIAIVAVATLNYIRQLCDLGKLVLLETAFTDPVIVTDTEVVLEGQAYTGPVGSEVDVADVLAGGQLPEGFRSAFDDVHEAFQRQEPTEEH